MNITGVDFITVPTQDFEKASEFYGDVLGLERSKQLGRHARRASSRPAASPSR